MNQDATIEAKKTTESRHSGYSWAILAALLLLTVVGVLIYWRYASLYPSTDNAYTGANIVRVAAQVSGPVVRVYAYEDEEVAADDPLFDIDSTPYEAALRAARAQFDAAANAAGTEADGLKAAADTLAEKRAALETALGAFRTANQAQQEDTPPSTDMTKTLEGWRQALQAFRDADAAFDAEQDKSLTVTTPTVQLRAAAAQLDKATSDRVRTHVTSPGDGWVSNIRLRPGSVVAAGTPQFAIIETGHWWVDANFKETDLARIRSGQSATIHLDMYPGLTIDGAVESISPGSGATFSVLPPENATGNWVKVTQRFPVRIKITSAPDPARPLRVGATATVRVDTTEDGK